MEEQYQVAIVAIEDGHPEYGPYPITANNALNAAEIAFRFHGFPPNLINTRIAVQLPGTGIALAFDYGIVDS